MQRPSGIAKTPDGSEIAWYDFGGSGDDLVLVHASGFCAQVLRPMAEHLTYRFHVTALDSRWHGRSRAAPGFGGDWRGFRDDVLAVVDDAGLADPIGFGHSCGGAALLLAEEASPRTFRQLYCYEAVVFPFDDPPPPSLDQPLAKAALRRRDSFASAAAAEANFLRKPPLSSLAPAVIRAYVAHGLAPQPDGSVRLICEPQNEAQIYAHGRSHTAYRDLKLVSVPVTLACGAASPLWGPEVMHEVAERLSEVRVEVFGGPDELGHLGPMERPELVAASLIRAVDTPPA